jgi:phosphoribosylformylglycinamidine cyclo-ligase
MTASTYQQDGVNLSAGDAFSAFAGEICRSTYENSEYIRVLDNSDGHFRGPRTFQTRNLPEGCSIGIAPDGIGTKVVLIDAAASHRNAAHDIIAMTCGDIDRWGGMPVLFSSVLDVKTLGETDSETFQNFTEMMRGLKDIAGDIRLVLLNGETAELGACVSSENPNAATQFNWSGFALGLFHPDKMITGNTLAAGQVVVAIRENGFRSNGISSVRKALALKFGNEWWNNPDAAETIQAAAEPSALHTLFFTFLNGWRRDNISANMRPSVKIHFISHVTGGSIRSKFAEILFARGLSADLDNLWEPPQIMRQCGEWRGLSDEDFYSTWNGGQGALFVIDEKDFVFCKEAAKRSGLELRQCGEVIQRSKPFVAIHSKFNHGKYIEYHPR